MNQEFVQAAASHSVRAVMRYLGTRLTGLSAEEVETQRSKFGVNTVTREKKKSLALVSTATDMIFPAFELFGSAKDDFDPLTVIIITVMVAISGGGHSLHGQDGDAHAGQGRPRVPSQCGGQRGSARPF